MADQMRKEQDEWNINWYNQVVDLADYEFDMKMETFKIADPIWRAKIDKSHFIHIKVFYGNYRGY